MPREPPVTSATLPRRSRSCLTPTSAPLRRCCASSVPRYHAPPLALVARRAGVLYIRRRCTASRRRHDLLRAGPGPDPVGVALPLGLARLRHHVLRPPLATRAGRARRRALAPESLGGRA